MTRRIGRRVGARWRALTGSASTAAAALGLLICLCTLLAVVGPRAAAQLRTGAFRQFIATAPAVDKAVVASVSDTELGVSNPLGLTAGQIESAEGQLRRNLRALPLAPAVADWGSLTTPLLAVTGYAPKAMAELPPKLELSYRDALARNVRVVSGRLPAGTTRSRSTVILQAAVSEATARRFGVAVGSQLALPGTSLVVAVTAIVQPRDDAAPFWTVDPVLAAPQLQDALGPGPSFWLGGVFIPASAVIALQSQINAGQAQVTWMFPLAIGNLTAAQATQLRSTLAGALVTGDYVTVGGPSQGGVPIPVQVSLSSGAGQLITEFEAEAASVASVLDLLSVSLAVLAALVVLLAGWLLTEQRRQEFAMLRARGASRRQLAIAILSSTALTAVPGAAAGAALAVALTPASPVALSWWLAGLVVLAALAGPVLITVRVHRVYAAPARADQPVGRLSSVRRFVVEAALVLGAAGGLIVLRYQGSGGSGDLYASAAPVLLATGVAVVVIRLYPLAVRGVLRLTEQRASAAAFLGLARAGRASATAALPAFALVLALGLASFAGMVRGAVLTGEVSSSWQQAGADAVIREPVAVSAALQHAVAGVPGVEHVATAGLAIASVTGGQQVGVLAVDPEQYRALLAGTPLPQPPAAFTAAAGRSAVPALAPPGLLAAVGSGPVDMPGSSVSIRVRVVGRAAGMSSLAGDPGGYLVLPRQALGGAAPVPGILLVGGQDLDRAALSAAVARYGRGSTVVIRSALLASLQNAPLEHGAYLALALGGVAAVVCGLVVLLLSLLLTAPSRQLTLARMSTMGLSAGQGRVIAVLEALPQLLAVVAGGAATAAALGPLLGPALSLSVFTGSASSIPVRIAPAWLLAAAACMLVLAIVTLAGQTAVTSHNAARSVRIQE
jgi:putative ABC transport system permease protein